MRRFGFEFTFGSQKAVQVERDAQGNWWNFLVDGDNDLRRRFRSEKEKIETVLTNPAALRVLKINCDLMSIGKVNSYNPDGSEKEKDVLYSRAAQPNKFQSWTQFFWDGMFWIQLGTGYLYRSNNVLSESTQLYWLNPARMNWDKSLVDKLSRFVFSKSKYNELIGETVEYKWPDGSSTRIPLKDIMPFFDLTNGISENWYKGESDLDALYQVIMNSRKALDAKGRNLDFAGKFMVSGQHDPEKHLTSTPMGEDEKTSIEQKLRSKKWVHAVKSQVNINRFVENINNLKIDEQFFNDYFIIGAMKGIPKDVLEVTLKGATFENQEKAIGRHIEYGVKPKAQMITDAFESLFGLDDLRMSWAHCMFNQVFEKDKADRQSIQINNIKMAFEMGGITDAEMKAQIKLIMSM